MAVNINGRMQTRSWEAIGENLRSLSDMLYKHNHFLKFIGESTYNKYKALKEDYDQGFIPEVTLREYLVQFKGLFESYPEFTHPSMHVEEIKEAIKAHCRW